MLSTAAMSTMLFARPSRPTTPDLTPLGLHDDAKPNAAPRSPSSAVSHRAPERPSSRQSLRSNPPARPAPLPPALSAEPATLSLWPKRQTAAGFARQQSAKAVPLVSQERPMPGPSRAFTEPLARPQAFCAPNTTAPLVPLHTVAASHRWLAQYLLRGSRPYGGEHLLAEDMLGAGILPASVFGADPLTEDGAPGSHRPFNEFKSFVEGLGAWCSAAPTGAQASYRVAAMRIGLARMRYERTLELQCLGLETLPPQIAQLGHLHKLDVRRNKLSCLPENCTRLRMLREVDLRYNRFASPPHLTCETLRVDAPKSVAPITIEGRFGTYI